MPGSPGFGMLVLRHALENAGGHHLTTDAIATILRGAGRDGSHLRAVFGDASHQALSDAAAACGIPFPTVLAAYAAARSAAAAANPELDAALAEPW